MSVNVAFTDDPARVLAKAGPFLESEPVLHNVILSLLPDAVKATVDAVIAADVALPGVVAEATTAALFAGEWTERRKSAAHPHEGQRIYELIELQEGRSVDGRLRVATGDDIDVVMAWFLGFQDDVGETGGETGRNVEARLAAGQYWLWTVGDDSASSAVGDPVSMCWASAPTAGVSRIGAVYTPQDRRNRGYAEACVREASRMLMQQNVRCMLFTQLDNPTSNAIYHRIGYRAIAEALRYRFE
jgi:predicted GNAT family acetyltransferase